MRQVKLGAITDLISSNVDKKSRADEQNVRLVNYTDVYYGSVLTSSHDYMQATATPQQIERVGVHHGDVIFTKDSETPDDIGIPAIIDSPDTDMVCGYHLTIARPHQEFVVPKYLYWYLDSAIAKRYWEQTANGVTRFSIGSAATSALPILLPPLPTQRAIADYLDRETAEIDGMRADLDEMERLLEERRVSIIQRHVLPETETYTRIKLVADVSLGKTVQKTQKDSLEVLRNYVRAAHIQPHGRLILDDQPMWFTPNELKQLTLEAGDVLVVEGGAGYGRSVYLREGLPGWGFQNHVIRVRPLAGASGRFIDYTIRAHYGAGLIDILADGATIPGLSSDKARELPILNVSYAEQRRIADEIDRETAEIDSMLEDITKLRDLLAERRAAVISAAVTGQIDIPVSPTHKDEPHA
ncbi:restriction endonuclease subunit S [Corynebacterium striatum]|uniref:restriction endonuclease subunit S n=1 Tax=Corynebacterium striatum TaxID=43770 RepID=UPI001A32FA3F|nr:type I restriction endonuclease subunit S [Corynebacterium striatum]